MRAWSSRSIAAGPDPVDAYAILASAAGPARLMELCPDEVRAIGAAAQAALAADASARGELREREIRPLAALPGWYAYRPPDTVGKGFKIEDILVMRSDLVERHLGYLPDAPAMLPG